MRRKLYIEQFEILHSFGILFIRKIVLYILTPKYHFDILGIYKCINQSFCLMGITARRRWQFYKYIKVEMRIVR